MRRLRLWPRLWPCLGPRLWPCLGPCLGPRLGPRLGFGLWPRLCLWPHHLGSCINGVCSEFWSWVCSGFWSWVCSWLLGWSLRGGCCFSCCLLGGRCGRGRLRVGGTPGCGQPGSSQVRFARVPGRGRLGALAGLGLGPGPRGQHLLAVVGPHNLLRRAFFRRPGCSRGHSAQSLRSVLTAAVNCSLMSLRLSWIARCGWG